VTAVTAVTVGIRIARAVTTLIIAPAVTAVTRRAFVTRPGGGMGDRGRRDRRDHGSSVHVAIAVAAWTAVIAELRPAGDVSPVGCGPSLSLCSSRPKRSSHQFIPMV
jgi:hypothetical protein